MATVASHVSAPARPARLFRGGGDFQRDLRALVSATVDERAERWGRVRYFAKAAFMLTWWAASYAYLMLGASNGWQMLLGSVSLALAMGGIGFAIQHDANHGALGRRARLLGYSLDMIGASSYLWRERHNHAHHTYTNVVDKDGDIEQLPLARFAPDQPWSPWHRYQHIYMFVLYGFYAPRAVLWGDFDALRLGARAHVPVARPHGRDLAAFITGKAVFLGWMFAVPLAFHPWWQVLIAAFTTLWILGILLAVVFQMAHCVEEAGFTSVQRLQASAERDGPREWTRHQVETTVDFARSSRLLAWYLGGLNFQVEHHLLPGVCHVHYRRLSPMVEALCARHGMRHLSQPTLWGSLRSHARWLRAMGQRPVPSA